MSLEDPIDPLFEEIDSQLETAWQACAGARLRLRVLSKRLPQYMSEKDPLDILESMRLALSNVREVRTVYPGLLRKFKKS